jgi:hypothetical protein
LNELNSELKLDYNNDLKISELGNMIGEVINVSINLRKVKKVTIIEHNQIHNPRPQAHVLLILGFGSFKSELLKLIIKVINGDIIIMDDVSMPALLGTISRNNQYIEGAINKSGGKILAIDEWDNLSWNAKQALLSPLENQTISRGLGFGVKEELRFNNNPFIDITVKDGSINGKIQFTCIANSMDFSFKSKWQYALGSRFRIIKQELTKEDMKQIVKGLLEFKFIDRNQIVENVTVNEGI